MPNIIRDTKFTGFFLVVISVCLLGITISAHSQQPAAPFSLSGIVEATSNAVVNISTSQNIELKSALDEFRFGSPEGDQFDLFRDFLEREFGFSEPKTRKATSLGSGFIIDPNGYIVTNAHVINGSEEINVTLSDDSDKTYKAKMIGADYRTDIALLKIEATGLPFLKFADSDNVKVGDSIIAIGNPFGFGGTVTAGIVSGKSRIIPGQFDEFIQIDASINRGNSGGPVINLNREVVGISSVIISPSASGGNVGIGLAIPSNLALPIIKQLKEFGSVKRGWIGVKVQGITDDIAKNMGMPNTKGALVAEVVKDSPADKVGIKVGDVIMKFDNHSINHVQKLPRLVGNKDIGKKASIELYRDGKTFSIECKIEQLVEQQSEELVSVKAKSDDSKLDSLNMLGTKAENITPSLRQKFNLDKNINGVLITKVIRGGLAHSVGIKSGDVIQSVNKSKINTVAELDSILNEAKKSGASSVVILITRGSSSLFLAIPLE